MGLDIKTPSDVLKYVKDNDIGYIDLRFTDPRGKWQHLTMVADFIQEDTFEDGIMFDGSSIAGWKANIEHLAAQKAGRESWYAAFELRVCKVERAYGMQASADTHAQPEGAGE